ncbi:protein kinase [Glycomyces sp. TRM65418]|uniref:protein kinase domain-containing protein n=1 Tax=Glycomyces sp. TRM65418 TaxID=2867006 RepID=UPI001CE6437C|nr:protein kinase [Glycomyces sp. TRM65418]MCC3763000.1 protein kinase [Glycomyces sp. TRM65418]QZD57016.1 protein kinase [Glycomyces sp. TRM65418]
MQTVLADRYVLEQEIARGAVGVVWRAFDRIAGDRVAVKVLRPELRGEKEIFESFSAEAEILRTIDHPGVVSVKDFIVTGAVCAVVLEFIEGLDLREHLRLHGPLAPAEAARRCASAAETLAAIHRAGYRHGDVKPGNLMLAGPEGLKFIDFGIARAAASKTAPSHGTPEYIAPEVAAGDSVSLGVDNYALGLVLYEALTAHSAYRGGSITEVVDRHLTKIPVKPSTVDARLWAVVERLLALDPSARGDLDAVAAELRRLAPDLATRPTAPIEPELRDRGAAAASAYEPVTPHAAEVDQGALGTLLTARSEGDARAEADGPDSDARFRRGLLLVGLAGFAVLAAAFWAVMTFSGADVPNEDDVADPSEAATTVVATADESAAEPTEPTPEASPTPGEPTTAPEGPEVESDAPGQETADMSESETGDGGSTEGGSGDELPGSDLIGSPMPDN